VPGSDQELFGLAEHDLRWLTGFSIDLDRPDEGQPSELFQPRRLYDVLAGNDYDRYVQLRERPSPVTQKHHGSENSQSPGQPPSISSSSQILSPQTLQSHAHPQGDSPPSQMPLPQPQSLGHEEAVSPGPHVSLPQAEHVFQKILEDANIKLTNFLSDVTGMSGRRLLDAIIGGQTDGHALADHGPGPARRDWAGHESLPIARSSALQGMLCPRNDESVAPLSPSSSKRWPMAIHPASARCRMNSRHASR
jgi:hypothetical protein